MSNIYTVIIFILLITIGVLIYIYYKDIILLIIPQQSVCISVVPPPDVPIVVPDVGIPVVPIPSGVVLNLSDKSINYQEYAKGRLSVSDNILTAVLNPSDGNGENKETKEVSKKQRNEISVKNKSFVLQIGQTGTWGCYFKVIQNIDWKTGFYHLIQIKYNLPGGNPDKNVINPIFTVSINNNSICTRAENGKYTTIMPLGDVIGKWIPMNVTVANKNNGSINYNINGMTGTMNFENAGTELYFKCGQYRVWPNDIKVVTTSLYKDISFKLNK